MVDFNLVYQIMVLVMMGGLLLLELFALRNGSHKSFDTRVSNGDTNVSLQTRVSQGERTITIPPVVVNTQVPESQPQVIQHPIIPQPIPFVTPRN